MIGPRVVGIFSILESLAAKKTAPNVEKLQLRHLRRRNYPGAVKFASGATTPATPAAQVFSDCPMTAALAVR
jgi:hypothetical protein